MEKFLAALKESDRDLFLKQAANYFYDDHLIQELLLVIEEKHNSSQSDCICEALFIICATSNQESYAFCMNFIPAVLWAYYSLLSGRVKWSISKVETLILAIYNTVVQRNLELPYSNTFRVPLISKPSIYHEPNALLTNTLTLTESTLTQHEKSDTPIVVKGPTKKLDRIPAGERTSVMKAVLQEYNSYLTCVTSSSHISFCNMVVRLSCCGFKFKNLHYKHIKEDILSSLSCYPKVKMPSEMVKEFVTALHFIAYDGNLATVEEALACLHECERYSVCHLGLLNTKALLDLLNLPTEEKYYFCQPVLNPRVRNFRQRETNKDKKFSIITAAPIRERAKSENSNVRTSFSENNLKTYAKGSNSKNSQVKHKLSLDNVPSDSYAIHNQRNHQKSNGDIDIKLEDIRVVDQDSMDYEKSNDRTPLIKGREGRSDSNHDSELPHHVILGDDTKQLAKSPDKKIEIIGSIETAM